MELTIDSLPYCNNIAQTKRKYDSNKENFYKRKRFWKNHHLNYAFDNLIQLKLMKFNNNKCKKNIPSSKNGYLENKSHIYYLRHNFCEF